MNLRRTPSWGLIASHLAFGAGAAAEPQTDLPATESVVVSSDRSGADLALQTGQALVIRLPGNPTTGYRWSLLEPTGNALRVEGEASYEPDPAAGNRVGAGGVEIWRFIAVRVGTATLRFEYRRPWETGAAPVQSVTYRVTVR